MKLLRIPLQRNLLLWLLFLVIAIIAISEDDETGDAAAATQRPSRIKVGSSITYETPFTGYSQGVQNALNAILQGQVQIHYQEEIEAENYVQLGLAHRRDLEDEALLQTTTTTPDRLQYHERHALAAFLEAVKIYQGLLRDPEMNAAEKSEIQRALAETFFDIGETYTVVVQNDAANNNAVDYYQSAHDMFQQLLHNDDAGKIRLGDTTKRQVELNWAHCCVRLATSLLNQVSSQAQEVTTTVEMTDLDIQDLDLTDLLSGSEDTNKLLQTLLGGKDVDSLLAPIKEQLKHVEQAEKYLHNAVKIFRVAISTERNPAEKLALQHQLAMALQSLGIAFNTKGDVKLSRRYFEEALEIYDKNFAAAPDGAPIDADSVKNSISEILYLLADAYMQDARYDRAKALYQRCMDWNEKYHLAPPPAASDPLYIDDGSGTLLKEYELVLQEYNEVFANGYGPAGFMDDSNGGIYFERDDGYEGDLHMTIGVLYTTMRGDEENDVLAASHLEQAIRLYELSGEEGQNMASVKFTLANLRLRSGEYQESAKMYKEALDIYQTNGIVNPLGFGIEAISELFQQQMEETDGSSNAASTTGTDGTNEPLSTVMNVAMSEEDSKSEILIDIQSFLKQNESLKDEL